MQKIDHKSVFNSSVITYLCEQKYLEPVPTPKEKQ